MDYVERTNEEISPVTRAIAIAGGPSAVADKLGLRPWAVSKWRKKIPADRVITLSSLGGWLVTPHMIAPGLYPHPEDGLPEAYRSTSANQNQ